MQGNTVAGMELRHGNPIRSLHQDQRRKSKSLLNPVFSTRHILFCVSSCQDPGTSPVMLLNV